MSDCPVAFLAGSTVHPDAVRAHEYTPFLVRDSLERFPAEFWNGQLDDIVPSVLLDGDAPEPVAWAEPRFEDYLDATTPTTPE